MYRLFLLLLYFLPYTLQAQNNYNNHWFFGRGHNVNFTTGSVQNGGIPPSNNTNTYSTHSPGLFGQVAYSHPTTGELEYFVQIRFLTANATSRSTLIPIFFTASGQVMPNGYVDVPAYHIHDGCPIIIPHPGNDFQSYVFISLDGGLYASIVDKRLNNGYGDVVPNAKMVEVLPKGCLYASKMTVSKSCNGYWLHIKRSDAVGYYSIKIDKIGMHPQIEYSPVGLLTISDYRSSGQQLGFMKASPNGKLLAVATGSGVELYDIEPCSGQIKNPRLIDTTTSFGVCFSPDNKVLYTTRAEYQTGYFQSSELVQWDVSNPQNLNSIKGSEQVILVNSAYDWPDWAGITSSYMGDIAQGKDGKLYVLSNTVYADSVQQMPTPMPPTSIVPWAQTMHIIHQPNNLGLACMPERDAHYLDGNYINRAGYYLPHPIYPVPNATIDTVLGGIQSLTQCFGQPVSLNLPLEATCIIWNTGSDSVMHSVQDTGWYWAKYNLDCSIHLDSFYVNNVPKPNIPEYIIACPEQAILDIEVAPHNIHQYQYDLVHTNRNDPRKVQTDSNWTWYSLLPGAYTLRVQSGNCDTSIGIFVDTFPRPIVVVSPSTDTITYGTTKDLTASGAYLYNWFPTISLDTGTGASVRATPLQTTTYEIIGINEFGCRDTAYSQITIDHSMEFFIPNAFSPNGDGLNDVFRLEGLTYQRLTEWGIFNRYGEQVFFTTNIQDGWDGTYRGQPCNAGVYYYYLQFFRTDGRLEERRGEVHLVR